MRVSLSSNMPYVTSMIRKLKKKSERRDLRRWMKEFMELKKFKKIQKLPKVRNLILRQREEKIQKEKKEQYLKEVCCKLANMMFHHQLDQFHLDKQE
jgi:hypothetical protein